MRKLIFLVILIISGCAEHDNTIKVKGSDTEVNLAVVLAENFHYGYPELLVSISGGGSGLGIASLLNGTADIANSSRDINEKELALFKAKNLEISSFIFAQDAIAFVVSDQLPIDSISTQALARVLSGEWNNWNRLTSSDIPINIYGRQSNSGTHEYIQKSLKIRFSPLAKQMNGNAQILEGIKVDPSGIGYVGAGYMKQKSGSGLKVLKIYTSDGGEAVSPLDAKKIISGKYFFQRPLYQFFKKKDYQKVKPFLDYEKTKEGLAIIMKSGYYPAKLIND
ncbi:PstS family phosphate ABC transporter substrate-binding protein [Emticicia sp. TH156]|uniref:PstS family phosphate ABC transporter substrate-binding protein n=1 Tax=Emticicia sp. TH156 TaxID=2067454 RepID=UPI000C777331|nr:PstS family phosphate ABC transporter substrate-binding protein [Emticicia sp. TH156]PLK43462.1 phosphate ABC transporter substrate-binding protein [Emticicia sp. TH156]